MRPLTLALSPIGERELEPRVPALFRIWIALAAWMALAPVSMADAEVRHGVQHSFRNTAQVEGLDIGLTLESHTETDSGLVEGDTVQVRFELGDTLSGQPLVGAYPAAWMDLRPAAEAEAAGACESRVERLLGGGLLDRAELDLNVFYVLALNDDGTITVVDPLFGFGGTRLLALVELGSPGADWALEPGGERLFVSLPAKNEVAVVETRTWSVARRIPVDGQPRRLAWQPETHRLWVGRSDGVTVLDAETAEPVAFLGSEPGSAQAGERPIVFSELGRHAFVVDKSSAGVVLYDAFELAELERFETGTEPVDLAWSSLASAAYVLHRGGALVGIDPQQRRIVARAQSEPGATTLRFAPDRPLGLALNPERGLLHVFDAVSGRFVQTGPLGGRPVGLTFSDELAYVMLGDSELVLMVPLEALGQEGEAIQVVDFPGGRQPFGTLGLPDVMARAPGPTAMVIAHPADRVVYYYMEGMAAPMGEFQNYGRTPRAVQVLDRSLRETSPGVYETSARLSRAGTYDLAFFLSAPKTVHCFRVEVEAMPDAEPDGPRVAVRLENPERLRPTPGAATTWTFEAIDPATGVAIDDLVDLEVLALVPPGVWHRRTVASPVGGGRYEATLTMPRQHRRLVLHVRAPSRGLDYGRPLASVRLASDSLSPGGESRGEGASQRGGDDQPHGTAPSP